MNSVIKTSMAVALAGALSLAVVTPSLAQHRGNWAAAGAGFAAGALVGAAAANANPYYYSSPTYGYAGEPEYIDETPSYTYAAPRPYYGGVYSRNYNPYVCSTDEGYGRRGSCDAH